MTTKIESTTEDITLFQHFQRVLRKIWKPDHSREKRRRYTSTITELSQEMQATQKSAANLRNDITAIRDLLNQILRDRRWGLG